jgi:hypothetical protein
MRATALGLRGVELVQHAIEVFHRRRHHGDHVLVEGDEPDAIPLLQREIAEARGEEAAVLELRDAAGVEVHGFRDVEDDGEVRVGLRLVLAHEQAIGAPVYTPVDTPHVVAGHQRTPTRARGRGRDAAR